jgi:fatty-acyl-CoA synthase
VSTVKNLAHLVGPPLAPPRHATLQAALEAAAASATGLSFLDVREQERALPFATLWKRARAAAWALRDLGIEPGDRVALILPTGVDFMDAFFGALCAGAVPVPLYPPVRLGRLDEYHARTAAMLQAAGARLLLTDARIGRLLGLTVERARPALGSLTVASLVERARGELCRTAAAGDLALIQFSSGTTVDPKPVALTHANVLANVAAIDSFLPEGGGVPQAGVSWLPLYHDMGLIGCLLEAVVHPGPLALIPPELFLARPALWLRAISKKRATISVAPNFAFGLCCKRVRDEELEGVDLSCWRLALNGAEPVSVEVLRRFGERFARFGFDPRALTPVYGLSEASLAVTFSPPGRLFRTAPAPAPVASFSLPLPSPSPSPAFSSTARPSPRELASVGVPVPGAEVRIADDRGTTLPEGEIGRVQVRSPSVMLGYFERPEATAAAFHDGWLETGDLGFASAGELFLCGRAKDLVILRGKNHAPQEFEDALDGIAGLRAGCAVALGVQPEGADGEELLVLAELDEACARPAAELLDEVRGRVAERTGVRPHEVRLLRPGSLPRTSSGKLRRGEALRQLLAGELSAPKEVTAFGLGSAVARSLFAYARIKLGP